MARNDPSELSASKVWTWSGIDSSGKRLSGQKAVGPSQEAVLAALAREGVMPIDIKEGAGGLSLNMEIGGGGVKFKWAQKADFARRMYQMLRAGISVAKSLQSMAEDSKPAVGKMCNEMAEQVMAGKSLSEAMREHPKAFDDVFVAYVASGEESGTLQETLGRLSVMLAKRAAMQSKINGVMAYPKMVGGTILVLVFGIIMFLVPSYTKIYASFGAELPGPTMFLVILSKNMLPITTSDDAWMKIWMLNPIAISAVVAYLVFGWITFRRKTKDNLEVGRFLDKVKYKMPLLGKLNHKNSLFRWASTMSGALDSGVPTTRGLELAAAATGSDWQRMVVGEFVDGVRAGRPISTTMAEFPELFPVNIRTMLATGEATGEAAEMLNSVSMTLDEEVDGIIAGLSAKIEVALLLVLGVVVGGILMILYLPILQLATTASKGLGAS